jgi:Fe-only nitrogenase accessory protein AnfO
MKVAVFLDDRDQIASIYGQGKVRLFDNQTGPWRATRDIAFALRPGMGLADVKGDVRLLAAQLEDCTIFVSTESRGLVHSLLQEEFGFQTWASLGALVEQLDVIAAKQAEPAAVVREQTARRCAARGCSGTDCAPFSRQAHPRPDALQQVAGGHYRIDLADVLKREPTLNSRMVLAPILDQSAFETLEIHCDHVPRWFSQALLERNLRADFDVSGSGVRVMVFPKH